MTVFTPPAYLQDGARTVVEMKAAFEQNLAATKEILGALPSQTITISGTSVTPAAGTGAFLTIATGGAATANLTNVVPTNVHDGAVIVLRNANSGQYVVVKHAAGGSGQINLSNGQDLTLTDWTTLTLILSGTTWQELQRWYPGQAASAKRAFYGDVGTGHNVFAGRQDFNWGAANLTSAGTITIDTTGNGFSVMGFATVYGISNAPVGTIITLVFWNGSLLVHGSNFNLGGYNLQAPPGIPLQFISIGTASWYLISGGGVGGGGAIVRAGDYQQVVNTTGETTLWAATIPN